MRGKQAVGARVRLRCVRTPVDELVSARSLLVASVARCSSDGSEGTDGTDGVGGAVQKREVFVKAQVVSAWRVISEMALILSCAAMVPAAVAHAQKAVLGPASAEAGGDSVRTLAAEALSDALRMQGFSVTSFEHVSRALPALPKGERCDESCSARLRSATSAELYAVAVVAGNEQGVPKSAQVKLEDSAGHHFEGAAMVRDGDVRDAVTRALLEARSYQLLGPGPWLRIDGTPEGAEVVIDERVVGKLPYRAAITAGSHRVLVREPGYARFSQGLHIPAKDGGRFKLRVALEPAPIEAPEAALQLHAATETPQEREGNHAWLAAPIAMAVLGVGLATVVSARLASGVTPCVDPDPMGLCTGRRDVNVWPTVGGYALSGVLIGAGIVWIALGTRDEPAALAANVGIDHVSLAGSF
jgi:hypothetical protein